jgi:transcription termination factor Rho
VVILRRALTGVPPVEAMELVLNKLKKTRSNIEFLLSMSVG